MSFGLVQMLQAPAIAAPYEYLVFDIETADGSPDDAECEMRQAWQPKSLATWGEETIGKRFKSAHKAKMDKLALLDSSPIIIVSIRSNTELRCLHWLEKHAPLDLHGAMVEGFSTQREMLVAFASLLSRNCDETTLLAGHNIKHFDLRKIRHAMMKHGVQLPAVLTSANQPVYDTMQMFTLLFSVNRSEVFPALSDLFLEFGIESHKPIVDGSLIPRLYEQKQHALLIQYAILDAIGEDKLFRRMTGRTA